MYKGVNGVTFNRMCISDTMYFIKKCVFYCVMRPIKYIINNISIDTSKQTSFSSSSTFDTERNEWSWSQLNFFVAIILVKLSALSYIFLPSLLISYVYLFAHGSIQVQSFSCFIEKLSINLMILILGHSTSKL